MTWTNVKEKLPHVNEDHDDLSFGDKRSDNVLVYCKSGQTTVAYYHVPDDEDGYGWDPQWVELGRDRYTIDDVTHWMILPKPPAKRP